MFLTDRTDNTVERWTSTDGINFEFEENIQVGSNPWKNPFVWFNPNDNYWYLYTHDASGTVEYFKVRKATNIEDLDEVSDTSFISRSTPFGSPTIMYFDGKYWLLGELLIDGIWKTVAYYSTTSPSSGFIEASNSPILNNDHACPMIFLDQNQTRAYFFSNSGSSSWYQETREVYIGDDPPMEISDLRVTDYQIKVTVHFISGVDDEENVYLNEHSRSDFGDIRFTWFNLSSSQEIECNYWIEELGISDYAVFWVKIPEISSISNSTIYVYYGKDNAITTCNGDRTFEFFDDFNGTLNKWTTVAGTWKIENGELSAETTATPFGQRIRANDFTFTNNSVHIKIKWISGTYFEHGPYVRGQQPNEQSNGYMTMLSTWGGDSRNRISKMSNGLETTIAGQGTTNPSKDVWYDFIFKLYGNLLKSSVAPLYSTEITAIDKTFSSGTLCLLSWSGSSEHVHYDDLFVCKYVDPEPRHVGWGNEETGEYVLIDQTFVSDNRADVGSIQAVAFHAKWNNNGSDIVDGRIYVNETEYITNATGWINFNVTSTVVASQKWLITEVNCNGVTLFIQTVSAPSIVWDQIRITDGGITNPSILLGETTTIWFKAVYEYDDTPFTNSNGILYTNGAPMHWSTINNRWEHNYKANITGVIAFNISQISDELYNITVINDTVGAKIVSILSLPFSIISNSTISELAFNSTSKTITFTISGPSGTAGYTHVTIAKTLIGDITELAIYIDGNQTDYTATSTEHNWMIHFTYHHSTHKVVMLLSLIRTNFTSIFPFEAALILSGILTIITATIMLVQKRKRKRSR